MPGMYVKAKIIVDADSAYALDNTSIVKSNESHVIFIKVDSTGFIPRKVEIGRISNNFSEIVSVNSDLLKAEIVTSGAYYLHSEMIEE